MSQKPDPYASEDFTKEYLELSQLPEPLRLAAALEKTMQWPLHGKAADCLRKLHAELESIKQAITDPENQPSQFGTVLAKEWKGLTEEEVVERANQFYSPDMYARAVVWAEAFWHAVVSKQAPVVDKAIRRLDVAEDYAAQCRPHYPGVEVVPLYRATPPAAQRQWVGLTDEEIDKTHETQVWDARRSYARAIEAKLKELNT
jgi:hypothetical protein